MPVNTDQPKNNSIDRGGTTASGGCLEVHAGRLLSAQALHGRDVAAPHDVRRWYADFRLETSRRAASVLLSTLIYYFRRRQRLSNCDRIFKLMLSELLGKYWKTLFPGPGIECSKVIEEPWSLPTIADTYHSRYPAMKDLEQGYVSCCERLLLAISPKRSGPEPPPISKCRLLSVVSTSRLETDMDCLYKIACNMRQVLELEGRL
uniref:Wsv419-like protein n=1 Tax=Metapenaeus ensis nimavirus TaxID=2133794 RepID=A0A401IPE2_9VIRU|nr:MAG: wsv419-like protein [Metapenaeus ensis nimavirus]GBG35483.1 wsv419-like protein [Metapenaeus ensis nimavirus]